MRRPDFSISRLICTLAPPPITRQFSAPPVLVARERTKIEGSYLLLSSSSPDNGPRKAWLGPAHQLARYALAESPATKTKVSLDTGHAMRRFARPTRFTNVTELGTRGKPYFSLKPHLRDMLKACLLSPKGVRGLFEADVVADREVITKLMFPHEASFNASFAHGVLFLEDARSKPRLDRSAVHKKIGFLRACTKMYTNRRPKLKGRVRHTFHAVVARPLGGLNLLLSGSIDCIRHKYTGHPGCYMNFVTRPMKDGKHLIRPTLWKEWYFRAHLMGVRSLFLGLVDEAGVLRRTRRLATRKLPRAARAGDGETQWDPEVDMRWAARVLGALRDFFQESADLAEAAGRGWALQKALWRVEISPRGGEVRVLVREVSKRERLATKTRLVPRAVLEAFKTGYEYEYESDGEVSDEDRTGEYSVWDLHRGHGIPALDMVSRRENRK